MILLLKIVDFGKKIYTVCGEIWVLLAFNPLSATYNLQQTGQFQILPLFQK